MIFAQKDRALVDAAVDVRHHAYAPYSKFQVGAAILLKDGLVVTGANVENVSYGLTVCAERNAIAAAVAAGAGPGDVAAVAIVTAIENAEATPPCGACRQVLAEFGESETPVLMFNVASNRFERMTLAELLPRAFLKDNLPES